MSYVLIAEDESFLANMLQAKLEAEGYRTVHANDGVATLERAREEKPALILLDVIMPRKDGLEVLKDLRQDDALRDIPVIVMTNTGDGKDSQKYADLGVVDLFYKIDTPLSVLVDAAKKYATK